MEPEKVSNLSSDLKTLEMVEDDESKNSPKNPIEKEVMFRPIDGESSVAEITEVESYCVNCDKNGTTKFLLTEIPHFKQVILSSFSCPHCNFQNNEIQSAHQIDKLGIEIVLKASQTEDLNRQLLKSDFSSVKIPEIDLEIMPRNQRGEITTVEGVLSNIHQGLTQGQPVRKATDPAAHDKIVKFLEKFEKYMSLELPFTLIIRDISGNSFISPPNSLGPGQKDEGLQLSRFERTEEENNSLGIYSREELNKAGAEVGGDNSNDDDDDKHKLELIEEVHEFRNDCSNCGAPCQTKMKVTPIPNFKEVVVMATDCDACGCRSNEIKSGSGIESKGRKITLQVTSTDDLCRDVLKSETCSIRIPELDLDVGSGLLGGKFTTLEGLLVNVKEQIMGDNPLIGGDSVEPEYKEKMNQFSLKLDRMIKAEVPFTVILDDPAGNSYLQNVYAPDDDPQMKTEDYERSFEQNDDLGLNDLKTENYAE